MTLRETSATAALGCVVKDYIQDLLKDLGYDAKRRRKGPDPNRPDLLRHVDETWKEKVLLREAPWRTIGEDVRRRRGFPPRR